MQVTESKRLVKVTEVLAPNFIVPGIKKGGKSVCLADFGDVPFELVLPLHMLAPHIDTRTSYPVATPTAAALAARATAATAAAGASSTADAAAAGPSGRVAASEDGSEDGSAGGPAHGPPMDEDAEDAEDADEQGMQAGTDGDYPTLSTADVERVRAASAAVAAATATAAAAAAATATAAAAAAAAAATASTSPLDSRPATIEDFFSCVLGDGFHYMDRPKVPG